MALRIGKTRSVPGLKTLDAASLLGHADAELEFAGGGGAQLVAFVAVLGVPGSSGTGDTVEKLKRPSSCTGGPWLGPCLGD
jgi:hypothetical protein